MITFDKINRRAHLYLGLFLMPWLLMYGVSSFIVIHHAGLIMWWRLPRLRAWGTIAVAAGILSFALLVWTL